MLFSLQPPWKVIFITKPGRFPGFRLKPGTNFAKRNFARFQAETGKSPRFFKTGIVKYPGFTPETREVSPQSALRENIFGF